MTDETKELIEMLERLIDNPHSITLLIESAEMVKRVKKNENRQ